MSFEGVLENIIRLPLVLSIGGVRDKLNKGELKPELHFRINGPPNVMGMGFPETARQS